MNKNHEGYTDYTACEAVRRAGIAENSAVLRNTNTTTPNLTYRLEEARGFAEAKNTVRR